MKVRCIRRDEIGRFTGSDKLREQVLFMWGIGLSSPERCFVAEEDGQVVGSVAYCCVPSVPSKIEIMWWGLDLAWEHGYLEIGADLLRRSLGPLRVAGARVLEWRFYSNSTPHAQEQAAVFQAAGLSPAFEQEKGCFFRDAGRGPVAESGRLAFQSMAQSGEGAFMEAIRRATEGTLDRGDQYSIRTVGLDCAAADYFALLKHLDHRPAWWQLAHAPDGALVGFVVPQKFDTGGGCISYIGVVPEQRGRGYVNDLLARGINRLVAEGARRVLADTDRNNVPMENALRGAGFEEECTVRVFQADLQDLDPWDTA